MTYSFALLQNFNDLITKLIPKSGFILTRLPYNTLVIKITEELKIMSEVERKQIEAIKKSYVHEEKADKMKELLRLNAAVSRPAEILAYTLGTVGALVLGVGMCFALPEVFGLMAVGIPVGIVGIALVSITYPVYKSVLKKRKAKFAPRIIELSDELLSGTEQ